VGDVGSWQYNQPDYKSEEEQMTGHIHVNLAVKILLVTFLLLMTVSIGQTQSNMEQPGSLRNPLNVHGGGDPWLTYYEGNYYLATTTDTSELTMRKSPTLAGLKTAAPVRIYFETDASRCCHMWAPEFHLLDGPNGLRWYFYYTAGTPDTYDNQRSYVLESSGTDPLGPYTYKSKLYDPQNDGVSIDGSVLQLNDSLYFLSMILVGDLGTLGIAPMNNPWTLGGAHEVISTPEYEWETAGGGVNQGPVALYHDDQTFIIYSASGCWSPDYELGMLTYKGGDPLSANSWLKNPEPVFQRADENGVFAPGHNGFFQSPDGTEDWIVYHADDTVDVGCDGRRTTRVQKFTWNADGTPNFGIPVSTDEEIAAPSGDTGIDPLPEFPPLAISRFKSLSADDAYLYQADFVAHVDIPPDWVPDSQFVVVPGLADPTAVSIESFNNPGFFLRHQNNAILLSADDNLESFSEDATWWIRPGLADDTWISFESYNQPGSYIGLQASAATLIKLTDATPSQMRKDATFLEER
jgi:GH43 family beta-xylosidase